MEICSVCKKEFEKETEYLAHKCTTGFTPEEVEHQIALDPNYKLQSDSALKRGETKK